MKSKQLIQQSQGRFLLQGELSFDSVGELLNETETVVCSADHIRVGLAGVSHFDSAGMALLIHWWRNVKKAGKTITFYDVPLQLRLMAEMSGLDRLLNIADLSASVVE